MSAPEDEAGLHLETMAEANPASQSKSKGTPFNLFISFMILAFLAPVVTGIYNSGSQKAVVNFTPDHMEQISGSFAWRFFEWRIFGGNGDVSSFDESLMDTFRMRLSTAQAISVLTDITHPTPFHFCLFFSIIALLCRKYSRRHGSRVQAPKG